MGVEIPLIWGGCCFAIRPLFLHCFLLQLLNENQRTQYHTNFYLAHNHGHYLWKLYGFTRP